MPTKRKRAPSRKPKLPGRSAKKFNAAVTDPLAKSWQRTWNALSDAERDYLTRMFEISAFGRQVRSVGRGEQAAFRSWVEGIVDTDVDVSRGVGRARVQRREHAYALDVQWVLDESDGIAKPVSVTIIADGFLDSVDPVPLHEHMVALALRLKIEQPPKFKRMPAARPERGKPPSLAYYRRLLDYEAQLIREQHPNRIEEIRRRLGFKSSGTVKAQLHRARKHVRKEDQPTERNER